MLLAVAFGGAVGAAGRHLVSGQIMRWAGGGFPWGTLTVNVLGSFLLGVLVEYLVLRWSATQEMRGFLVVGLLGGFTTFSAFSLDAVNAVAWAPRSPLSREMWCCRSAACSPG